MFIRETVDRPTSSLLQLCLGYRLLKWAFSGNFTSNICWRNARYWTTFCRPVQICSRTHSVYLRSGELCILGGCSSGVSISGQVSTFAARPRPCSSLPLSPTFSFRQFRTFQSPVVTICTTSLTLNNSTFCPHCVFMCFVWL